MDERIQSALRLLPDYLARHVLLSASALALGIVLGLPLGLWLVRHPRLRWPALAAAGFVQTIPGLALLGAVLSAAARAFDVHRSAVRLPPAGARLPALAARAHALFHAADPAQRGRRPDRARSGRDGGRERGRHDVAAAALAGRGAAGGAGRDGGNPHRRGLDHRGRDPLDLGRPDQSRQLHLHRAADRELDLRAVRLRGRGGVRARGRSAPRPDRGGCHQARCQAHLARRRLDGGGPDGRADAAHGERVARLPGRGQELQRAIHSGRAHLGTIGAGGRHGRAQGGAGLGGRLPGARRLRHRRLCGLFRNPVGERARPQRHAGERRHAERARRASWRNAST